MLDLSRAAVLLFLFISTGTAAAEKIDINTAPLADLVKIIHIGEVRALELISLRPFSSLDELIKIKGIGEMRLKDIKEQGLAWVASQSQPELQPEPEPKTQPQLEEPKSQPEPKLEEPKPIIYPSGIVINEILPSPEGIDEKEEWIEFFNQNDEDIDLSGWQIADTTGSINTYTFPEGTKISAQGFLVLSRPTTKITLNNDGDGLNLIQPNGKIIDSVTYEKAPQGQSYNRIDSNWVWSNVLTPGSANIIPKPVVETKGSVTLEKEIKETVPKEKGGEGIKPEQELAAIGKQIPEEKSNFFLILSIALALAIFSGIIVFFLKKTTTRPPHPPKQSLGP